MATCKDCIHYDVCIRIRYPVVYGLTAEDCEHFAHKNWFDPARVILLPCRADQTLYTVSIFSGVPIEVKPPHRLEDLVKWLVQGRFGNQLFLTKEGAEAEVERRKNNGKSS